MATVETEVDRDLTTFPLPSVVELCMLLLEVKTLMMKSYVPFPRDVRGPGSIRAFLRVGDGRNGLWWGNEGRVTRV